MITETIRLAVTLAAKDIRLFVRDKTALALGFLLPIALVAVFAGVFGSIGMSDSSGSAGSKITLRIADLDRSDASRKLLSTLDGTKFARADTEASKGTPYTRESLYEAVRNGDFSLGFVLAPGFGAKLDAGDIPPTEVIRDSSREIEFQIASQAFFMAMMEAHGDKLGRALAIRGLRTMADATGLPPEAVVAAERIATSFFDTLDVAITNATKTKTDEKKSADSGPAFTGMASMLDIKETTVGGGRLDRKQRERIARISQPIAGTAVMMLLFGLVGCGSTLLREREQGTLRRLFVTPAPRGAILAGKFLFTVALGLSQLVVMFAFGALVFHLPIQGHLGGILLVSVALCAAATGFGIFIASIGRSEKQIEGISTLVILVMSAVGGSWFPLNDMVGVPQWMIVASHFTLNAWAMDAYQDLWWRDRSVVYVLPEVGVLFTIAIVLSSLATYFFRKRFASAEGV